ncbi:MAG: hypothetical protein VX613_03855 [Candidatus Thermoplasmatota archaeon]|nr:hypothetical protein [Candidatus Thermoplasmatota archaeon]
MRAFDELKPLAPLVAEVRLRVILSIFLIILITFFTYKLGEEAIQLEKKHAFYSGSSECVDAPNVVSIEFQQSTVILPSHETLLIQATLKDSSGAVVGIDPDWSSDHGSITPIIGLQQARFTPGILSQTTIWACAGSVNQSITVNVIQGNVENLIIQASKENFSADESTIITLQGEDIRGNIFSLYPQKQNWTYPEGSILSISNEITWSPKHMGWHNISVQESGIEAYLSFNISHGAPIRLSIIGDEMLITSDESVELQSVLVDAGGNQWPVISNWSTGNSEASEWLTDLGDRAIFDGWTVGSWKIFSEYTYQNTGQFFASQYDILVSPGELNQILLDGHGMTFTVDEVFDLNPRAIDSAGNLIQNIQMTWTINGQVSTGTLEENEYVFSTETIGLYEIQVISEGGSASITFDFIHGEAIRLVLTETGSNQLTVKSGEMIELLTEGEDQYGNRFALNVNWSLTNGTGEMNPSSRGIGYYDFKPGDASGFVMMEYSGLGLSELIVIEIKPGDVKKLRIEYEGELKQGNTVRLLISAVDDSGNIVSFCDANSAIVTSEIGSVIRENNQLYLKFKGSGSTTIDVGCYGFKETFYLQVEDTILWGIFEDTQTVIIYSSLLLMLIITILLVIMIQRSRREYEEYEESPQLPVPRINPSFNMPNPVIPQLPVVPLPLPPLPLPRVAQPPLPQVVVPQQSEIPKVESNEEKLGNAMNLLGGTKLTVESQKVDEIDSNIIEDDDLSWD